MTRHASDDDRRRRDGRPRRDRARLHDRGSLPDRHGRDSAERRRTSAPDSIVAAGTLLPEGTEGAAAVAGDGQPGQGQARADRRRGRGHPGLRATATSRYRLDYMSDWREPELTSTTSPPRGTRDFLPDDVRRREYVIGVIRDVYERYGFEPLETPAFENIETLLGKYGEEGNKLIFKILQARRARGERRGRSRAALRPDRAARARRRAVPERAAAVLQALSDSAGVARRSAGARPVPRVLPVRRRRDRIDVAGRRSGAAARRSARCCDGSGSTTSSIRLNHRARADGAARGGGRAAPRCTAMRWSRSTSWTRSAPTACATELAARGIDATRRAAACLDVVRERRRRSDRDASTSWLRRFVRRPRAGPTAVDELDADRAARRRRRRRRGTSESTRAWRAACHTTPARSWRSRCPTWPAASAAAAATTT